MKCVVYIRKGLCNVSCCHVARPCSNGSFSARQRNRWRCPSSDCVSPSTSYMITVVLTMINRTWVAYFAIFHWHWRLAHACCFADHLAWIARGRPRRKLCVLPNYSLTGFSPSPEKQVRIGLATEVRDCPRNMVQTDGVIAYDVAARTQDTCCKTSRHLCSKKPWVV